jgi:hypothetical protein
MLPRRTPPLSQLRANSCHTQVDSTVLLREGKSHTQFLLEDAMAAGRDDLADTILGVVTGTPQNHLHAGMCPGPLIQLAKWVCPF